MLWRYELGEMVGEEDASALTELLSRHRHAGDLLGRPISGFRIAKGEFYGRGGRRFEIVRPDTSTDSFSYLKCIAPRSDPHFEDFVWAMRCEVLEQTRKFHDDAFAGGRAVLCGITGEPIKQTDSQVDHAGTNSFRSLVAEFLKSAGLRISDIRITDEGRFGECAAKYVADRAIAAKWQEYHREHATLRVTSKKANLRQKKVKVDFSTLR